MEAQVRDGIPNAMRGDASAKGLRRGTPRPLLAQELQALRAEMEVQNEKLRIARDQAELALARFTDLYDTAPIGYCTLRRDGTVRDINLAGARLLGLSPAKLRNQLFGKFVHDADLHAVQALIANVIGGEGKQHCELRLLPADGHCPVVAHIEAIRDYSEQECRLALIDITDRKYAEELARQSDQRFFTLAATAFEGLAVTIEGRFVNVNDSLLHMLGYKRPELIGRRAVDFVPAEDRERIAADMLKGGDSLTEHEVLRKDGTRLVVEVHGKTIVEDGVATRLTAFRDITKRRQVDDELRAARAKAESANAGKSRFLAAVSHDLRQPLSALAVYVSVLEGKLPPDERELAKNMKQCIGGLSELLSGLLDLSKLEAGVLTPKICDFSLDGVLQKVASALEPKAQTKGLALRYGHFGTFGRTDPVLFQRILTNLVANAIRYTERGGVLIGRRKKLGKDWIEVWDTGIGIPADKTSEIFEEFKQLGNQERDREKGTGIGLTIVAQTAALLGLQVRVRSRQGRGSMFAVELPPGAPVRPLVQRLIAHRPLRIALVEDNAQVANALAYSLTAIGHSVVVSPSRKELAAALTEKPDIVVSDYRLGAGENGCDVIAAMRATYGQDLPAMIITGDTDPALMRELAERGICVQHKPLDVELFRSALAELTGTRAA
jgi:PAS domain S-box-containing protein